MNPSQQNNFLQVSSSADRGIENNLWAQPVTSATSYVSVEAPGTQTLKLAAASSEGNPFFKADPGLVLWTWLVFGLTLLTLYKFAWKPILKMLDERETRINQSLKLAEETEAAARQANEQNEKILAEARQRGEVILSNARKESEALKVKLEQETQASIKTMTAKAEAAIRSQKEQAQAELKAMSVELSLKITHKLLEKNVDASKNEALAKKFLDDFK